MFSVTVFAHYSKPFLVTFPSHCSLHLQPLVVAVMGPFKAKYALAQSDWMVANQGGGNVFRDLTRLISSAHPVSFLMKNLLAGCSILMFGSFQEMHLVIEILRRHLSYAVEVMTSLF